MDSSSASVHRPSMRSKASWFDTSYPHIFPWELLTDEQFMALDWKACRSCFDAEPRPDGLPTPTKNGQRSSSLVRFVYSQPRFSGGRSTGGNR
jgi:hypothetical protein